MSSLPDHIELTATSSTNVVFVFSEREIHPLHHHILLYTRKYDALRTAHALSCLKAMLMTSSRHLTHSLVTTSLGGGVYTTQTTRLITLLVRHRK